MQVTLSEETAPEVLERLAIALASCLRIRWGAAGYGYATRGFDDIAPESAGVYAHARRYQGYDVGYFVRETETFFDRVRTASWLTFLGPALATQVASPTPKDIDASPVGENLLLRAGAVPSRLDVNRLENSAPYAAVDRFVASVRATKAEFGRPWTPATSSEWLD